MKSPVFFFDVRGNSDKGFGKLDVLLNRANIKDKISGGDLVAIKLHFGEKGNTAFVRPPFLKKVAARVKECRGKPFLTDTNTLYRGSRGEAVSHLTLAYEHGFDPSSAGAPVVIADGVRGNSGVTVEIGKPHFRNVFIAREIHMADALICVTHFKGHELSGFGGTLKNLGMGCASRAGKLSQHSNISPQVKRKTCKGCERCLDCCPQEAITLLTPEPDVEKKRQVASIDPRKCIGCAECIHTCPSGAITIRWNETTPVFQRKMVEHALGALRNKNGKALYLNFLTTITPACDCNPFSDAPIVPDIGILSSEDPIAIDQASVDLVNGEEGSRMSKLTGAWPPGEDKFRALYPGADWSIQLTYGEEIGLGTREYELIKI